MNRINLSSCFSNMGVADYLIEQGITRGRKIGRQEGIQKGEARGIKKTRDESALAMLKKGYTTAEISEVLNLSRSYILSLKKKFRTSLINEQN